MQPFAGLTYREQEVLALIGQGLTSSEIAERLYISARTVETHRANIRRKLELGPRPFELLSAAIRWSSVGTTREQPCGGTSEAATAFTVPASR